MYVDSGSTDNSVALAREYGVAVVNLDMSEPFTAARARNVGFWNLLKLHPALDFVFFVDGDCEVISGWVDRAVVFLDQSPDVAVVFGYRRERYPRPLSTTRSATSNGRISRSGRPSPAVATSLRVCPPSNRSTAIAPT